jgi:ubiquinone/menaquinone biosynthesis C-methylase UbiE
VGHDCGHRFDGAADRLRAPERIARLEVKRVAVLSIEGLAVERVLDVGTGTGLFAQAFSKLAPRVVGLDINPAFLEVARRFVPEAQFTQAPAEKIPFGDGWFDLVFLGVVLHETDNPLKALKEARRVTRSRVAVLEWPYRHEDEGPPLEHRLSPATIEELAGKAGYRNFESISLDQMDFYRLTS